MEIVKLVDASEASDVALFAAVDQKLEHVLSTRPGGVGGVGAVATLDTAVLSERWNQIDKESLQSETEALRAEIAAELASSSTAESSLSSSSVSIGATPALLSVPSTPPPTTATAAATTAAAVVAAKSIAHATVISTDASSTSTTLLPRKDYPLLRVGVIGAGANTRTKHIPLLQCLDNVRVTHLANRTLESSKGMNVVEF